MVYLLQRFLYRIGDFFHHWYVDASRLWVHNLISALEYMDRTFAVRITLKHFFMPLYGDYTIIGRFLGVIFRSGRVLIGSAVYLVVASVFAAGYIIWALVPPIIILYVLANI